MERTPDARFFLLTLDEWTKMAQWDPDTSSWRAWFGVPQAGGGYDSKPTAGVDLNVASVQPWIGHCFGYANGPEPGAPCAYVAVTEHSHYQTPFGAAQVCGNGMDVLESCGEHLGKLDCRNTLNAGMHPWLTSRDCMAGNHQQSAVMNRNKRRPVHTLAQIIRVGRRVE